MAGTTIKIVSSSGGEGSKSTDEAILEELKKLNDTLGKGYQKTSSGFSGFGGGGAVGGLLSGAAGVAGGVASGQILRGVLADLGLPEWAINMIAGPAGSGSELLNGPGSWDPFGITNGMGGNYEKIFDPTNGNVVYAETDKKTGEILRILTEQQAEEEGILDKAGNIKRKYEQKVSVFDEITENLEHEKDAVVLSVDKAKELGLLKDEEIEIQKKINEARQKELESLKFYRESTGGGTGDARDVLDLMTGQSQWPSGSVNTIVVNENNSVPMQQFQQSLQTGSTGIIQAVGWIQGWSQ